MKQKNTRRSSKTPVLILAGLVLAGGSFYIASGSIANGANSVAAAFLGIFGSSPVITISTTSTSPSGIISPGVNQNLAAFDVSVSNVRWQGSVTNVTTSIAITGQAASNVTMQNIAAHYTYCIPSGVTYGYGYKGGSCGAILMQPVSNVRNGNVFTIVFSGTLPVYPQQSYGALIVSAQPSYTSAYTVGTPQIAVNVTSANAIGDQCNSPAGARAKISCGNTSATVMLFGARGNLLTLKNPYGYQPPTTTQRPILPRVTPSKQ